MSDCDRRSACTERGEKARALFDEGYNCAQAVFAAFEDVTGFDRETSVRLASALGGGMCRMREVCGAVSGAMLVLGTVMGADTEHGGEKKAELYRAGQAFAEDFRAENGSIVCRELLGLPSGADAPEPEKRCAAYYKKRPCAELVRAAAELLERRLGE